jgi:imidazolonepropionase-like amidohydrolase
VTTDATTGVTPGVPSGQPGPLAITGARVLPVDGAPFTGVVLVHGGRIDALGPDVRVPEGAERLDAAGLVLTPGLIDAHSHLGIDEEASGPAGDDVNERMDPVTPHVRAIDAVNPADLGFADALRGGVLTINVLTGSGNPIGGLGAVLRTAGTVVDDMIIRSPSGLKSALGENPSASTAARDGCRPPGSGPPRSSGSGSPAPPSASTTAGTTSATSSWRPSPWS